MTDDGQSLHRLSDRLHSASLHLVRMVRTRDAEMGLSPARASAMSVLVFGGPRTIGALAAAEGVRSPTMTQLVSRLEQDGLVERRASTDDRREVVVDATPAGRTLLQEGRARRVQLLDELLGELDPADLAVLERASVLMEQIVGHHNTALSR